MILTTAPRDLLGAARGAGACSAPGGSSARLVHRVLERCGGRGVRRLRQAVCTGPRRPVARRGARPAPRRRKPHRGGARVLEGGERVSSYCPFLLAATVSRARRGSGARTSRDISAAGKARVDGGRNRPGVLVALQNPGAGRTRLGIASSLADPGKRFGFPYQYNLVVISGNRSVLPGETVAAEAMNFGSMRGEATLHVSTVPGVWNGVGVRGAELSGEGAKWFVYRYEFADVREDFTYFFSAGGVRTAEHRVTVIHRPVINGMTAILKYPPYTRAKADTLEPLAGRIVALAGTRRDRRPDEQTGPRRAAPLRGRTDGAARPPVREVSPRLSRSPRATPLSSRRSTRSASRTTIR